MKKKTIVRVGELNNFNHTQAEYDKLVTYKKKGRLFFTNSSAKSKIRGDLPCFVTLNPDLDEFVEPQGDLSNVAAYRVKLFVTDSPKCHKAMTQSLKYCEDKAPALITFMRFPTKKLAETYVGKGRVDPYYVWEGNYWRPKAKTIKLLIMSAKHETVNNYRVCDEAGTGCPDCGNCISLAYGMNSDQAKIVSLNLKVSGKKDAEGNHTGECIYDCPGCLAKVALWRTKGVPGEYLRPSRKQLGKLKHIPHEDAPTPPIVEDNGLINAFTGWRVVTT